MACVISFLALNAEHSTQGAPPDHPDTGPHWLHVLTTERYDRFTIGSNYSRPREPYDWT
jgi:hypothetical protein